MVCCNCMESDKEKLSVLLEQIPLANHYPSFEDAENGRNFNEAMKSDMYLQTSAENRYTGVNQEVLTEIHPIQIEVNINEKREIQYVENFKCSEGVYTGEIIEGKRSGQGNLTTADKIIYSGSWENDKPEGKGKLTYSANHYFEGDFKNGHYHGYGFYQKADSSYLGYWENGLQHGKGTEKIEDFLYEGDFYNGKKHGNGMMKISKGTYEGKFANNTFIEGTFISNEGIVTKGSWSDGKLKDCTIYPNKEFYMNLNIFEGFSKGKILLTDGREFPVSFLDDNSKMQMILGA
ncbi:hypothetical protein SteCoe_7313 [Stentor coeruleus]|uniref:MORN repeat protein n=1 Tax=Stentor coeruleus TaxID=5963 RepID=A0A1R2CMP7_9CILI|nr:hypothetical protein SteCoe_7313 [Stentor coeruleus]